EHVPGRLRRREVGRDLDRQREERDRDREHAVAERDDARELQPPLVAVARVEERTVHRPGSIAIVGHAVLLRPRGAKPCPRAACVRMSPVAEVISTIGEGLKQAFLMAYEVWWALVFGFAISAIVQAWVPRQRIEATMSGGGPRPIAWATGLGAASSS